MALSNARQLAICPTNNRFIDHFTFMKQSWRIFNFYANMCSSIWKKFVYCVLNYQKQDKCYNYNNGKLGFQFIYKFIWSASNGRVVEWLRRWTANPVGAVGVGSNPSFHLLFLCLRHAVRSSLKTSTFWRR